MKRLCAFTLTFLVILSVMVTPVSAAEVEPSLPTVEWGPGGMNEDDANQWDIWIEVSEALYYRVALYNGENDMLASERRVPLGDTGSILWDVSSFVAESGTYTVGVAKENADGTFGEETRSAPKSYDKPTAFATPTNLRWEGTVAHWDATAGTALEAMYLVSLYRIDKDGDTEDVTGLKPESVGTASPVAVAAGVDFFNKLGFGDGSKYVFTVRVMSSKIGTVAHSEESAPSSGIGYPEIPAEVSLKVGETKTIITGSNFPSEVRLRAMDNSTSAAYVDGVTIKGIRAGAITLPVQIRHTDGTWITVGSIRVTVTAATQEPSPEKLPAPASVTFNADYSITFPEVAGAEGRYLVRLYKDGEVINESGWQQMFEYTEGQGVNFRGGRMRIVESGTYWFGVSAVHPSAESYSSSPLNSVETLSNKKTYTRPPQALGTPTDLRWQKTATGYTAMWNAPANAIEDDEYEVRLYREGTDGQWLSSGGRWGVRKVGGDLSVEFDATYGMSQSGVYVFTVRAISSRMDSIAHSVESGYSAKVTVGDVGGGEEGNGSISDELANIGDVTDGTSADNALNDLTTIGAADLGPAMQGDATVADTVKGIEDDYNTVKGITVETDASTVSDKIDGSKIDVIGAGFNADTGAKKVTLNFTVPAKEHVVDESQYKNVVQFDIKLAGAKSGPLAVPVQITMPIPDGVYPQMLSILHVKGDGSVDVIYPRVNNDGTVTFTVTSFSIFVFANRVQNSPSYDHDWSQDLPTVAPPPQEWKPGSPSLTAPVPSAPSTNFYRVLARSLNQRGGPGTNYPIMGKLSQNALIQIVGFSEDGQWAQTSAGTWLSMAYLSGTNAASGTGNYVVNVSSSLNVRSGPGTGSSTIGKLYAGASVRALSVENGWALIEYNGGTAYVSAMYLR